MNRTGSTDTPFLYNGQDGVITDENGLYYMRARYYNPDIKRFVNLDVLLGSIDSGQSLNRYAYVNGNPVLYTDPYGLFGFGLELIETTEMGGGSRETLRWGQTGSVGVGYFFGNHLTETQGSFATWGGMMGPNTSYPDTNNPDKFIFGMYAGGGVNFFISNASSINNIQGPFHTVNLNVGLIKSVSLQLSWDPTTGYWIFSFGGGPMGTGLGASLSYYDTNTWLFK
ncbi:hypothetical protein SSCH_1330002 [Syntrophaceticus schinkii]|uniref:RHS repeat-associated core domain-containing protein n=1 Tax=Syntrophaceticus schinkii TaxID=499207 RepID=A0A0B7MBK5_9FIRM|nr:hypothetical protein SSCH_1330002 [Syntrophaceticus schinkii]